MDHSQLRREFRTTALGSPGPEGLRRIVQCDQPNLDADQADIATSPGRIDGVGPLADCSLSGHHRFEPDLLLSRVSH